MKKITLFMFMIIFSQASFSEAMKVVYHFNESEKAQLVIATIDRLILANPGIDVKVIVQSSAVKRLAVTDEISKSFQRLVNHGVYVGACSNSMIKNNLMPSIVVKGVKFISEGGIQKILDLQKQGYLYIKI